MKRSTEAEQENITHLEVAYKEAVDYAQQLEGRIEKRLQTEAELERRTAQLALVGGIGRRITGILDLPILLNTTASLIQEMFDYHHVALYVLDGNVLKLSGIAGLYASHLPADHEQNLDQGIVGLVATTTEPVVVNDVRTDARFVPLVPEQSQTRSEMSLPVKLGSQILGVLDVRSRHPDVFTQFDVVALDALTNQIAVAIENARLHQTVQEELSERKQTEKILQRTLNELQLWADEKAPDLKRANEVLHQQITVRRQAEAGLEARAYQQAVVADFGQRALAGVDLPSLMNEAVELTTETLGLEFCQILELLPDVDTLLLRAGTGWRDGLVGQLTMSADTSTQMGYTLLSSEPVIVENWHRESRFSAPPLLYDHGVISGMSVIIDGEQWPFGVLGVHTTGQRTFNKDDVNFLQAIANILAQAIERKRAEVALRESEEKYRTLIEKSSDAIFLIYGTRFELINHRFTDLFGVSQEQANSPDFVFTNIIAPKSRGVVKGLPQPRAGEEKNIRPPYEFTALDKDGAEIEVELTVSYPTYQRGLATQGIVRDITERKRIEEEKQTALQQAQAYAAELSEKIREVERQKEIATILAEVVASVSLTLSTNELLNHILLRLQQLIAYDSAAIFLVKDEEYLVMEAAHGFGSDVINQEFAFRQNSLFQTMQDEKSYIYIQDTGENEYYQFWPGATQVRCWIGAPLLVAQKMIGYLSVDRHQPGSFTTSDADLAQAFAHQVAQTIYNARLFTELRDTQNQLIQRERLAALGQMAATVAHELRNPLMAIGIGVEYLIHEIPPGDPRERGAALMQANMDRINRIVDDILYVARAPKPNLTPGSLHTVLENEIVQWEMNLPEKDITFQPQLSPASDTVLLDADQIGRVVSNLISNGADAVGPGGELTLKMVPEQEHQIIIIADNGPGISPEYLDKIFEPFFTTKSRGTGLGLSIAKQIIDNHQGTINVWSEIGVGTRFTITLPHHKPE